MCIRVVDEWNKLNREMINTVSIQMFKKMYNSRDGLGDKALFSTHELYVFKAL